MNLDEMQNYKYGKLDVIVLFVSEISLPNTINFRSAFLNANQLFTCRKFHIPHCSHDAIV